MLLLRLHVYRPIKTLKPINYLKIVMLTSPGFFFKEANLYLRTGRAGGFHRANEVKLYLAEDTAFIAHLKSKQKLRKAAHICPKGLVSEMC